MTCADRKVVVLAVVDTARCTGCGWCVPACPWQLLSLQTGAAPLWKKTSVLSDPADFPGCGLCVPRCPFGALSLQPVPAAPPAPR